MNAESKADCLRVSYFIQQSILKWQAGKRDKLVSSRLLYANYALPSSKLI